MRRSRERRRRRQGHQEAAAEEEEEPVEAAGRRPAVVEAGGSWLEAEHAFLVRERACGWEQSTRPSPQRDNTWAGLSRAQQMDKVGWAAFDGPFYASLYKLYVVFYLFLFFYVIIRVYTCICETPRKTPRTA